MVWDVKSLFKQERHATITIAAAKVRARRPEWRKSGSCLSRGRLHPVTIRCITTGSSSSSKWIGKHHIITSFCMAIEHGACESTPLCTGKDREQLEVAGARENKNTKPHPSGSEPAPKHILSNSVTDRMSRQAVWCWSMPNASMLWSVTKACRKD